MKRFGILLAVALIAFGALASIAGAQVMVGTTKADNIYGTPGDDVLRGRGGDDTIQGNGGTDALYGGSGNDHLKLGTSGAPGYARCGSGNDFVTAGVNVKVAWNCEHVSRIK